jgi:hypothetical protein
MELGLLVTKTRVKYKTYLHPLKAKHNTIFLLLRMGPNQGEETMSIGKLGIGEDVKSSD